MSKILKTLQGKMTYYGQQRDKALIEYMRSGLLKDRLSAVRLTEKHKAYEEISEMLKSEVV